MKITIDDILTELFKISVIFMIIFTLLLITSIFQEIPKYLLTIFFIPGVAAGVTMTIIIYRKHIKNFFRGENK